jgi:hypothetical protein
VEHFASMWLCLSPVILHLLGLFTIPEDRGDMCPLSEVKWKGREAKHSSPIVPRSRKRLSIHPLPHTPTLCGA